MGTEEQHVPYNVISLSNEAHKVCPLHVQPAFVHIDFLGSLIFTFHFSMTKRVGDSITE